MLSSVRELLDAVAALVGLIAVGSGCLVVLVNLIFGSSASKHKPFG